MTLDLATLERLAGSAVLGTERLVGGDVAEAFRVELADGSTVFTKTHRRPPPGFFTTEAIGLAWLREATVGGGLGVPEVIGVSDDPALLVLEWIDERRSTAVETSS